MVTKANIWAPNPCRECGLHVSAEIPEELAGTYYKDWEYLHFKCRPWDFWIDFARRERRGEEVLREYTLWVAFQKPKVISEMQALDREKKEERNLERMRNRARSANPDLARMDEEVELLLKQTPPEVIERMDKRLQELRKASGGTISRELLQEFAGR